MSIALRCSAGLALLVAAAACDPTLTPVTFPFQAVVGDEPFACGATYEGLGTRGTAVTPLDFRMYLYDVVARTDDGDVPVVLDDNDFQNDGLVLLDFEDGSALCATGSPRKYEQIRGTVENTLPEDITGVSFTLGVPEEQNHLDGATAPAPQNVPGMWWNWVGGYKFVRLDAEIVGGAADGRPFYFHHGATSCEGTPASGIECAFGNRGRINLDLAVDGTGTADAVVFDVAEFYGASDLETVPDFQTDFVEGCMAFSGDPDCPALFNKLGITFESDEPAPAQQSVFQVVGGAL